MLTITFVILCSGRRQGLRELRSTHSLIQTHEQQATAMHVPGTRLSMSSHRGHGPLHPCNVCSPPNAQPLSFLDSTVTPTHPRPDPAYLRGCLHIDPALLSVDAPPLIPDLIQRERGIITSPAKPV